MLLLMERSSDNLRANPAGPTASRTTNMLLISPSQQATENAGANAAGASTVTSYQHFRPRDGNRGEDPRTQGGSTALVRTNALTQSILTEAISNARGAAAAQEAPHAGTMGQRQLAGLGMGMGGGRHTEHPLISRQVCNTLSLLRTSQNMCCFPIFNARYSSTL